MEVLQDGDVDVLHGGRAVAAVFVSGGEVRGDPVRAAAAVAVGGVLPAADVHHGGGLWQLLVAPVVAQWLVV